MKKACIVFVLFAFFAGLSINLQAMAEDREKGYTLTPVEQAGENTVTKYEYNEETKTLEPQYFEVNLAKTEYGNNDGADTVKYFVFTKDKNGNNTLTEGSADNYDVVWYGDSNRFVQAEYGNKDGVDTIKYFVFTKDSNGNNILTEGTADNYDVVWYGNSNRFSSRVTEDLQGAAIDKDFVDNNVSDNNNVYGGAINNQNSTIGDITGDFIGNYGSYTSSSNASSTIISSRAYGGAIYNENGIIGDITGDFIGNYIPSSSSSYNGSSYNDSYADGGAIYNKGTIGNIAGDFIGNYVSSYSYSSISSFYSNESYGSGGAIYNIGTIGNITGDFIGNYVFSSTRSSAKTIKEKAYAYGGAIYNTGAIEDITGDFIGNYTFSTGLNSTAYGGAIYNIRTIEGITGDFIGNYALPNSSYNASYAYGGAIYNRGTIKDIKGNFIGNYVSTYPQNNNSKITGTEMSYAQGGAIYNGTYGTIGNITGDFIGNYAPIEGYGGAIYNGGTINSIKGDFIGNYVSGFSAYGGAIYNNRGKIENITGDFINNYVIVNKGNKAHGGAIYNNNSGIIGNVTGDFIGNYTSIYHNQPYGMETFGGAIYNKKSTIGEITGDFIGNRALSTSTKSNYADGGAIYNEEGTIGNIQGDFIGNYARANSSINWNSQASGGAIYNQKGTIGDITGNFVNNYTNSYGGAIYNKGTIEDITGNFIDNHSSSGGAIYNNNGTIGDITGNFIDNYTTSYGGAIYNSGTIGNITGDFIGNYVTSSGGAIYNNNGTIGKTDEEGNLVGGIYGSFVNNYAKTTNNSYFAMGGAVYTKKDMNFIADNKVSTFSGNYTEDSRGRIPNAIFVETSSSSAPTIALKAINNGAIVFDDQIDGGKYDSSNKTIDRTNAYNLNLTGDKTGSIRLNNDIINANATHDNVALHIGDSDVFKESDLTSKNGTISTVDGKYKNYNFKSLNSSADTKYSIDINISKDSQNTDTFTLKDGGSGTIYLSSINVINNLDDNEKYIIQIIKSETDTAPELNYDNSKVVKMADAIMTSDMIIAKDFGLATTKTKNDSIIVRGLQDALCEWAELKTDEDKIFTFVDGSDYVMPRDIIGLNGQNITINGSNNILNLNNKNLLADIKENQTVNISNVTVKNSQINNNGSLNLSSITLDETVSTINNNVINLTADNKLNGNISGSGSLNITDSTTDINGGIQNQKISVTDSTVNLNNSAGFNNNLLTLNNSVANISDLGLNNLQFDTLSLNNGNININSVDVDLINKTMGRITANNYGEITGLIDVKHLNLLNDATQDQTEVLFADTQIADNVKYTGKSPIAYSDIYKYDVSYNKNPEDNLGYFIFNRSSSSNPSDNFNPSVLPAPVAAQAGAYTTQTQTFNYAFQYSDNFMTIPYMDRLAIKNSNKYALSPTGDATDVGTFSPLLTKHDHNGFWVKPYASFENIPLKNGPKVSNINYGTLIGYDSELQELRHGFDRVITGYVGYNGASQRYSGIDSYQNGGILGSTVTLYKGNFFNATTLSVGASSGSNTTYQGHEDFALLLAGIGNKTGYNFEFKDGRVILQPNFLISYTFVNTFDYTNAAGLRIKSDPLNAIQLSPGLKLIGNTKNGWQPYIGVNMVWNLLDKTKVTADDVRLPEMSIKPYVQYGVGVQKCFKEDKMTAFGQAMIHNGGRNGISLTFGLRWKLGK